MRHWTRLGSRLFDYPSFSGTSHCRLGVARRFILVAAGVHRTCNRASHGLSCALVPLRLSSFIIALRLGGLFVA
jgi:hypothetical protein